MFLLNHADSLCRGFGTLFQNCLALDLTVLKEILFLSLNDSDSSGLLETIEIMSSGGIPDKLWATLNCE